jgi:hypothetical protein
MLLDITFKKQQIGMDLPTSYVKAWDFLFYKEGSNIVHSLTNLMWTSNVRMRR